MVPYLDDVQCESDGSGVLFYGGARIYKRAGTGLVTKLHNDSVRMQVENVAGALIGTYWDSGNLPNPVSGTGTAGSIPKWSTTTSQGNSLLSDTGTEIRQSNGLYRFYNPNLTDFAVALTRGTAAAPDTNSAFVIRMDGYHQWGAGGASARDTNLYRSAANVLKTDDTFDAATLRGQNITASRALVSDGSKNIVHSATTSTELGYLSGVTSAVQTQLNGKYRDFGQLTGAVDYNNIVSGARGIASIFATTVSNTPPGSSGSGGQGALWQDYGANNTDWRTQLFVNAQSDYLQFRTMGSPATWRPWRTVWHDGNFNPALKADANAWTQQSSVEAGGAQAYFNDVVTGDLIWRFWNSTKRVRLGVFDGAGGNNSSSIWLATGGAGFAGWVKFDALSASRMVGLDVGRNLVTYWFDHTSLNLGDTMQYIDGVADPFYTTRFSDYDLHGGVRTWYGVGPFSGSVSWYNVVDILHRNGTGDGASGYGGVLAWGMTANQTRLAFASRSAVGSISSWTEVWTKADISDANMPRLNANQSWTGENTFFEDLSFRSGGFDYRSGPGGSGYGSGGFFAREYDSSSEPYNGLAFSYSASATRSSVGIHSSPNSEVVAGLQVYSAAEGGSPFADLRALGALRFVTDIHSVTSSDITITKLRTRITSTAARQATLPSPSDHSLAIIMVETDATTGNHNVVPPSGSEIYWTDHAGTSRVTAPAGAMHGSSFRMTRGAYWFVSDGTYWYAVSPGRN